MPDYSDTPQVFVESLRDRNEGRILGEWIDLTDYTDGEEVLEAIAELLKSFDEAEKEADKKLPDYLQDLTPFLLREEWIVTDYEGFPERFYSEHMGFAEVMQWVEDTQDMDEDRKEAYEIFQDNFYGYVTTEKFEEAYLGKWDSEEDYAEQLVDDLGYLDQMPDNLRYYFDYEKFARDIFISDYHYEQGHVFNFNI